MKKKFLAFTLMGLGLLGIQPTFADICALDCWYISASGSISWHNNTVLNHFAHIKHKTGYGGNAAIGFFIDACWRLELEGVFRYYNNDHIHRLDQPSRRINHGHLWEAFVFLNLLYDIPVANCLDFYFGAGAGAAKAHLKLKDRSSPETSKTDGAKFAYQFLTGVVYNISTSWDLILGYRYLAMTKPSFNVKRNQVAKVKKIPYSNNIDLGLRYKF